MWRFDDECFEDRDSHGPLSFLRSRPVEDDEAELIETICHAATPGPWVTDDRSDGSGVLIATLSDGRHIVSLKPAEVCLEGAASAAVASAQLICEARSLVLRLLRDRQRSQRREKCLIEKIEDLEEQLERQVETVERAKWVPEERAPAHPR